MDINILSAIYEDEEGIVKYLFNKLAIEKDKYIICDNNRPLKVVSLFNNGWEYALAASKGKGSIKDGIDIMSNLKVYYTETSTNLEYESENYQNKVDRYGIVIDEPLDADNHIIDPTRYVCIFLKNQGIIRGI